ncbi:MAG: AbrB family transcriptional regulator [Magnetococcales bacterium]|nr:AbrB family transcriptional regulator [Magnetococcales bacterium]
MDKDMIALSLNKHRPTLLTLGTGLCGGVLAHLMGLPAPALLGSTLVVSAAALSGQAMRTPVGLRHAAFTVIGCSLGSGFTPDFFARALLWPVSLLGQSLTLILIMLCSGWILTRFFGHSRQTAILASSPGGLSFAIALAAAGVGNGQAISVIQSLRLLFIVLGLPPLLLWIGLNGGEGTHKAPVLLTHLQSLGLFMGAYLLGNSGARRRVPAAHIFAGMLLSGGLHGFGLLRGTFPVLLLNLGFVITGAVIGSRFRGVTRQDLRQFLGAATLTILTAITLSATAAWFMSHYLGISFGQVWIAYAPGGVEAMAAMAFSMGYDASFVATHHLFRILLLIGLVPFFLRLVGRVDAS